MICLVMRWIEVSESGECKHQAPTSFFRDDKLSALSPTETIKTITTYKVTSTNHSTVRIQHDVDGNGIIYRRYLHYHIMKKPATFSASSNRKAKLSSAYFCLAVNLHVPAFDLYEKSLFIDYDYSR